MICRAGRSHCSTKDDSTAASAVANLIGKMFGHHIPVPGEKDAYYAYGLTVFKYKDVEIVGHGGFSRGYGSMIQMVPARKFAVIVLTNKSGETLRKTLNKATEIALGLKDDEPQKPAPVSALTAAEMQEYAGSYSHPPQTWDNQRRKAVRQSRRQRAPDDEDGRTEVYVRRE